MSRILILVFGVLAGSALLLFLRSQAGPDSEPLASGNRLSKEDAEPRLSPRRRKPENSTLDFQDEKSPGAESAEETEPLTEGGSFRPTLEMVMKFNGSRPSLQVVSSVLHSQKNAVSNVHPGSQFRLLVHRNERVEDDAANMDAIFPRYSIVDEEGRFLSDLAEEQERKVVVVGNPVTLRGGIQTSLHQLSIRFSFRGLAELEAGQDYVLRVEHHLFETAEMSFCLVDDTKLRFRVAVSRNHEAFLTVSSVRPEYPGLGGVDLIFRPSGGRGPDDRRSFESQGPPAEKNLLKSASAALKAAMSDLDIGKGFWSQRWSVRLPDLGEGTFHLEARALDGRLVHRESVVDPFRKRSR